MNYSYSWSIYLVLKKKTYKINCFGPYETQTCKCLIYLPIKKVCKAFEQLTTIVYLF